MGGGREAVMLQEARKETGSEEQGHVKTQGGEVRETQEKWPRVDTNGSDHAGWSGHDGGPLRGLWNLMAWTSSYDLPSLFADQMAGFLFNKMRIKTALPDHTGAKSLLKHSTNVSQHTGKQWT